MVDGPVDRLVLTELYRLTIILTT